MVILTKTNPYTSQPALSSTTPAPHPNLLVRFGFTKVCGYENGNPQLPLGCPSGYDCKHDGVAKVSGCCNTAATATACALETTCIDYSNTLTSSVPRAHTCDEAQPLCTTGYFIDGYSMFTCGGGTQQTQVSLFYHAQSDAVASSQLTGQSQQTAPRTVATASATGVSTPTNNPSNTPTGAIAGGVVGGVVLIIVVVGLIWFIPRRKRKEKAAASVAKTPSDANQTHGYPEDSKQLPPEKDGMGYAEMEAPAAEMPGKTGEMAHEVPYQPASPSAVGRSELYGS